MNASSPSGRVTPAGILGRLDERIVGQEIAKRKLANALWWNHHRRLLLEAGVEAHTIPPRQNVLLAGPSGTGKTLLVRTAAERLGVPWFATPATSYSRVGYVGLNPEDMVAGLLQQARGDVAAAERGVIFLDEVDKLRRRELGGQDDVGGDAVQQMLLALLEGVTVQVKHPGSDEKVAVCTAGITFVAAGAFAGLEEVVLRRIHRRHDTDGERLDEEAYRQLSADDLVDYGLIPEFVARFAVRAGLIPLDRSQLDHLLRDLPTSPLRQAVHLFRLHGVELRVEEPAVRLLLELAMKETTGARALMEVWNDRLGHVVAALPELLEEGVARVIVDADTVAHGAAPWKIAGELAEPLVRLEEKPASAEPPVETISNTRNWSPERIRERLDAVKSSLGYPGATGTARGWWDAFEREEPKLGLVLRLAEELAVRKATIAEFFLAYVYSNTDNIQANLHYLDYSRLKKAEERSKRDQPRATALPRFRTGDACPAGGSGLFEFDGYVDAEHPEPGARPKRIALEASAVFPAGPRARPCWWRRVGELSRRSEERD